MSVLVGHGTYSLVFKGLYQGREAAIKRIHDRWSLPVPRKKGLGQEIKLLRSIEHEGICKFFGLWKAAPDDNVPTLIFELLPFKLSVLVTDGTLGSWSASQVKHFLSTFALAVAWLNEKKIFHLRISPENIMLTLRFSCKLISFDCAQTTSDALPDEAPPSAYVVQFQPVFVPHAIRLPSFICTSPFTMQMYSQLAWSYTQLGLLNSLLLSSITRPSKKQFSPESDPTLLSASALS
jgi:serine/threonine protein kinase